LVEFIDFLDQIVITLDFIICLLSLNYCQFSQELWPKESEQSIA